MEGISMQHYKELTGTIFDIERNSFVDGPGIRTTVFFKGCNLKCAWCHNPESQDFNPQMMFYKDKCKGCGKCKDICPTPDNCTLCGKCALYCPVDARKVCGKKYTVDEIFTEIVKDKAFYDYESRQDWARKMLVNIVNARHFSSDITIEKYNKEIWKL
jgi:pyruvate-formate lyase-activating enzyme